MPEDGPSRPRWRRSPSCSRWCSGRGCASSDTKIDLHVDPVGFLGDVASAWSSTGDLGHVQGGQYGGYLFPMGPFFALGHALGLRAVARAAAVARRCCSRSPRGAWCGSGRAAGRRAGSPTRSPALLFVLNPYVVVFTDRTTVTLLGYAALPWLLLCVHRGLRGAARVVVAGGVRADRHRVRRRRERGRDGVGAARAAAARAVRAWIGAVRRGATLWGFALADGMATARRRAWWIVPLLVQSRYGVDFLPFTEQPGTIWTTTSLTSRCG